MYVIVGLGNPDKKYEHTRHNIGFDVIDALADKYNISVTDKKHKALCGSGVIEGMKVLLVDDVMTAGTAVRETMPILYGCGNVKVNDMFISVNRCEVGKVPGKTAIMEVNEEFGIKVHAIVTVEDIHEYLKQSEKYNNILPAMEDYMAKYCIL